MLHGRGKRSNCTGKELRKTHYSLGHANWDPESQYHYDYKPYELLGSGPTDRDSKLRKSNFKFGDDKNPYETTSRKMNEEVEKNPGKGNQGLNESVKSDLRRNHFDFGNFPCDFSTSHRAEFTNKFPLEKYPKVNFPNDLALRAQSYVLGDDKPDFSSEMRDRFRDPGKVNNNIEPKISTAALQQSHYVFGTNTAPWNSTHQASYTPKKISNDRKTKDLTKTNFKFGDDVPKLVSQSQATFVEHPVNPSVVDPELVKDLRAHHFQFGRAPEDERFTTDYRGNYVDPGLEKLGPAFDDQVLRRNHWEIGDGSPSSFDTTYNVSHTPKKADKPTVIDNKIRQTSIYIPGDNMDYLTDYRDNYTKKDGGRDPKYDKFVDDAIKNIRRSNFALGNMPNDFSTTNRASYKYDPNSARDAKGKLNSNLIDDLKATHYKLGYEPFVGQSTQNKDYIPLALGVKRAENPNFQANHFGEKGCRFEGESIYHSDYVPKPIDVYTNFDC